MKIKGDPVRADTLARILEPTKGQRKGTTACFFCGAHVESRIVVGEGGNRSSTGIKKNQSAFGIVREGLR